MGILPEYRLAIKTGINNVIEESLNKEREHNM